VGIYAGAGRVELRLQGPKDVGNVSLNNLRAMHWIRGAVSSKLYELSGNHRDRPTRIVEALVARGQQFAVMESLSGGLVASHLVAVPGASQCLKGGIIAYTEEAKTRYGVDLSIIERYGAVSPQCVLAMARLARVAFNADIGLATTGFAGPGGGSPSYPVGTFFVAVDDGRTADVRRRHLSSERGAVRQAVVELALTALWELLELG
jgi:PncC family amidohydrolase